MAANDTGWDGPVEIDYRFYLPEFSSAMKQGYDQSGIGKVSGELRNSLGLSHLQVSKGKDGVPTGITINNMPVYARIQDVGGRIPERFAKPGSRMHYFAYGAEWFMKSVKGFNLPGHHYIQKGLDVVGEKLGLIFAPQWKNK